MLYDATIDTYTRQAEILEERLRRLREKGSNGWTGNTYSQRIDLLESEIAELRISAKHLRERQGGGP